MEPVAAGLRDEYRAGSHTLVSLVACGMAYGPPFCLDTVADTRMNGTLQECSTGSEEGRSRLALPCEALQTAASIRYHTVAVVFSLNLIGGIQA